MQIGKREQANGTIVTGPWLDRPAPRRPSPVATKAKGAQPQQPVFALAGPPTVTLTHLKPDATGTLPPRASAARPERARDRSKTTTCRDFQDSRLGSRLVTGRTSRVDATQGRNVEATRTMRDDGRAGVESRGDYVGAQMKKRAETLSPEECHYTGNTQSIRSIFSNVELLRRLTIHPAVGE